MVRAVEQLSAKEIAEREVLAEELEQNKNRFKELLMRKRKAEKALENINKELDLLEIELGE